MEKKKYTVLAFPENRPYDMEDWESLIVDHVEASSRPEAWKAFLADRNGEDCEFLAIFEGHHKWQYKS